MKKGIRNLVTLGMSTIFISCTTPTTTEKVASLDHMEGKYSKMEAYKEFGEPGGACMDHTWTESCKWEISMADSGRSPASGKSTRTLRLWFDKKGVLVKKNYN